MKRSVLLTITSLIAVLLSTIHLSDDIVRGFEPGGFKNLSGITMFFVWMYGALVLSGRRSGYIVVLLGSLLGMLMPIAHMRGAGLVGGSLEGSSGLHLFVWTVVALELVSMFSLVLSIRSLWKPDWARQTLLDRE